MILLGDVFWLGYDPCLSLAQLSSGKCPEPKPVQNDRLIDACASFGQHMEYCSFLFASSPAHIAIFDKRVITKTLNDDFVQLQDFPIFRGLPRDIFAQIYTHMDPIVVDKAAEGTKPIMHIGDPADGMFVVRQGKVDEFH